VPMWHGRWILNMGWRTISASAGQTDRSFLSAS